VSRVCLEATGQYHLTLALDDAGLARMVITPRGAKRFTEAMQTRTKTDAVDAAVLAQFAQRMFFTLAAPRATWPWPSAPARATSQRSTSSAPKPRTSSMRRNKPRHPTS